ncbi:orotate phosphoribosyltransferase [Candidatus Mycalebacterium sp.]
MSLKREKDELRRILLEQSVQFGDFTLASGVKSSLYIDARKTTLHPEGARLAAAIFLEEFIKDKDANAIGGPTLGADPIVGAVLAFCEKPDIHGFIVRKEEKKHGTQRMVEGNLQKGDRAVIVEDVITTGGSVLRAVGAIRAVGAEVSKIMVVVNRSGTNKLFEDEGIDLFSIFDVSELVE